MLGGVPYPFLRVLIVARFALSDVGRSRSPAARCSARCCCSGSFRPPGSSPAMGNTPKPRSPLGKPDWLSTLGSGGQTTCPWAGTPCIPLEKMAIYHVCTHSVFQLLWYFAGAPTQGYIVGTLDRGTHASKQPWWEKERGNMISTWLTLCGLAGI